MPIPMSNKSTHKPKDSLAFSGKKYLAATNAVHTMQRAVRKCATKRTMIKVFSEPKARMPMTVSVMRKDTARNAKT